jgi:hypothetical protein
MPSVATDYFNAQSPLRGLASRIALHARRGIYARFVTLAGTAPGRRLLDLGVTPDTRDGRVSTRAMDRPGAE